MVASKYALSKARYATLKRLIDKAIVLHDCGRYKPALNKIKRFLSTVENTKYKVIPGENFNGDHLMRGSNITFMYTAKVIPFDS